MKRSIASAVAQLVISPLLLLMSGNSPHEHVDLLLNDQTPTELFASLGILLIWIVWVWGVVASIISFVSIWNSGSVRQNAFIPAYFAVAAAALAGALNWRTSHSSVDIGAQQAVPEATDDEGPSTGESLRATMLATLAGFMLSTARTRVGISLRQARRGTHYQPHSRLVQLVYRRLFTVSRSSKHLAEHAYSSDGHPTLPERSSLGDRPRIPIGCTSTEMVSIELGSRTILRVLQPSNCHGYIDFLATMANVATYPRGSVEIRRVNDHIGEVVVELGSTINGSASRNSMIEFVPIEGTQTIRVLPMDVTIEPFSMNKAEHDQLITLTQESLGNISPELTSSSNELYVNSHDIIINVMGPIEMNCKDGSPLMFRKSKSEELLAWLVLHRDRPLREIARTAIWDHNVQDSTFNNVLSELRRAIREALPEAEFEESRHRKGIALPGGICTDVDLLDRARISTKERDCGEAWSELRLAVERVRGLPFEGAGYEWADAEGLTSHIVLKIMNACSDLAHHYLEVGDVEGVFFATSQGLRALPGSEEMLDLRSRAAKLPSTVRS